MSRFGLGFVGAAPNGNDAFTNILMHFDGSLVDSNARGLSHTWTAHGAAATGTAKFGSASLDCGSTGWVDTPDSADYTLGSGDWTIDFWFNSQGGSGATRYAFGQCDSGNTVWSVIGGILLTNVFFVNVQGLTGGAITGTIGISTGTWYHIALVRSGGTLTLYVNGVADVSHAVSGTVTDSASTFAIGRAGAFATTPWNGYIDEFRLSVGIARWTANFTPPTTPYG